MCLQSKEAAETPGSLPDRLVQSIPCFTILQLLFLLRKGLENRHICSPSLVVVLYYG